MFKMILFTIVLSLEAINIFAKVFENFKTTLETSGEDRKSSMKETDNSSDSTVVDANFMVASR